MNKLEENNKKQEINKDLSVPYYTTDNMGSIWNIVNKKVSKLSKKRKKIKMHYGFDVIDIFGETLFSIEYDKIYNKKGKLKKINILK